MAAFPSLPSKIAEAGTIDKQIPYSTQITFLFGPAHTRAWGELFLACIVTLNYETSMKLKKYCNSELYLSLSFQFKRLMIISMHESCVG